jgi:hypothetical protein
MDNISLAIMLTHVPFFTCWLFIAACRYTPLMPRRHLFGDLQRDRYLESDQVCFSEHGDTFNCSNFVDIDWLSSSGNSCEEEPFERYFFFLINHEDEKFDGTEVRNC